MYILITFYIQGLLYILFCHFQEWAIVAQTKDIFIWQSRQHWSIRWTVLYYNNMPVNYCIKQSIARWN